MMYCLVVMNNMFLYALVFIGGLFLGGLAAHYDLKDNHREYFNTLKEKRRWKDSDFKIVR